MQIFDIQCNQVCSAYGNMPDRNVQEVIAKVSEPVTQWRRTENEGNGN